MPDAPWSEPAEPWSEPGEPWSEAATAVEEFAFGKTAEFPHQARHPELTKMDRFAIMSRGGNPEVGQRHLESRGFEVQHKGGFQYALKKGRGGEWYFFDEPGPSFQDISDVAGDVLSLGGMIGGAAAGTALGAPSGPGAFAAGVAGAGVGTGLAQGLRTAAGEAMGIPSRAGEVAGEIGQEAIAGAAGQFIGGVAGKALGLGARALKRGRARARRARRAAPPPTEPPLAEPALPAKPPPGVEIDQAGWDDLVRNRPHIAQGAVRAAEGARGLPPGREVPHEEMVAALKRLGPEDPAVAEFLRRETSRRTGAEKGSLRTLFFQMRPDVNRKVMSAAKEGAHYTIVRNPGQFGHLTEKQLADLYHRQAVHGLSKKTFDEVVKMAKGMPAAEIDDMISSLSHRFPYDPAAKGLFGPVVDIEARSAQIKGLGMQLPEGQNFWGRQVHIPLHKEVDFWRSIPLEGLRKLQLPDGTILQLSRDQAVAAKHIASDIMTRGVAMRRGVARALLKLEKALGTPRRLLVKALGIVGLRTAQGPLWKRTTSAMMGGAGLAMGGKIGTGLAIAGGTAFVGSVLGRIGRQLLADTAGNVLKNLAANAGRSLSLRIEQVLKLAAGGPLTRTAYRAGIFQLLSDPEFQELVESQMGGAGRSAGLVE